MDNYIIYCFVSTSLKSVFQKFHHKKSVRKLVNLVSLEPVVRIAVV